MQTHPPAERSLSRAQWARQIGGFLEQQLYFWGQDVLSPWGNLLKARGATVFRRDDRPHAVHCYQFKIARASILLHSTGVELSFVAAADGPPGPDLAGASYLRPYHRLFALPQGHTALPCRSASEPLPSAMRSASLHLPEAALLALLTWIRDYESWVAPRTTKGWRDEAWRRLQRVPKGVRWLTPFDSCRWLDQQIDIFTGNKRK